MKKIHARDVSPALLPFSSLLRKLDVVNTRKCSWEWWRCDPRHYTDTVQPNCMAYGWHMQASLYISSLCGYKWGHKDSDHKKWEMCLLSQGSKSKNSLLWPENVILSKNLCGTPYRSSHCRKCVYSHLFCSPLKHSGSLSLQMISLLFVFICLACCFFILSHHRCSSTQPTDA